MAFNYFGLMILIDLIIISNMVSSKTSHIKEIKECEIDNDGIFKYIQIQIDCNLTGERKIVVRGWKKYEYHKENFAHFKSVESKNIKNCKLYAIGGGRININSMNKKILVYGYSKSYGICDHSLTCKILQNHYPDFECNWNNDGY